MAKVLFNGFVKVNEADSETGGTCLANAEKARLSKNKVISLER